MSQTRRLAAILAADVAGYSRLMGMDEGGTLERLRTLRRELLDPKIAEHHGRLVKTTGDVMLVEFANIVDAVRCAVDVPGRAMVKGEGTLRLGSRRTLQVGAKHYPRAVLGGEHRVRKARVSLCQPCADQELHRVIHHDRQNK